MIFRIYDGLVGDECFIDLKQVEFIILYVEIIGINIIEIDH